MVPLAGIEPARCYHHLILSQARLPIPPQGHGAWIILAGLAGSTQKWHSSEERGRIVRVVRKREEPTFRGKSRPVGRSTV